MTTTLLTVCLAAAAAGPPFESSEYEGRPHLVVPAGGGTAWIDTQSGGLSRFIDAAGEDWIAFRMKPWGDYPDAAAGAFRGFPNLVFGEDPDAGFGHPGHDTAVTKVEAGRPEGVVVRSEATSGRWSLRWVFTPDAIEMTVTSTPEDAKYWVLYEGPIGGEFDPPAESVHAAVGTTPTAGYDFQEGSRVVGVYPWVEFRDADSRQALRIERVTPAADGVRDTWAQLGASSEDGIDSDDGMMVFGFGRGPDGIDPLLTGEQTFRLRFVDTR